MDVLNKRMRQKRFKETDKDRLVVSAGSSSIPPRASARNGRRPRGSCQMIISVVLRIKLVELRCDLNLLIPETMECWYCLANSEVKYPGILK